MGPQSDTVHDAPRAQFRKVNERLVSAEERLSVAASPAADIYRVAQPLQFGARGLMRKIY